MTIIIKPTFSCNFRCSYCYLSNGIKADDFTISVESVKVLVEQIAEYVKRSTRRRVTLLWHGGEPLLWGIDNYKEIFAYTEHIGGDVTFRHSIQTNLSLITEDYIALFKKYNVRVGFSLDGYKEINDSQRKYSNGRGTFADIIHSVDRCRSAGLNVGAIIVASSAFKGKIPELYGFLCEKRLNFKFNPLFLSGEAENCRNLSLTPSEYAQMSMELFDLWFDDPVKPINESTFIDIASYFLSENGHTNGCMFAPNCQQNIFAVSPRGEIFPCGRFCETDTRFSYGNINKEPLSVILARRRQKEPYTRHDFIKEGGCGKCRYFNLCHGGCLHDGYLNKGDFKTKTFLCSAYKQIFSHVQKRMHEKFPEYVNSPDS